MPLLIFVCHHNYFDPRDSETTAYMYVVAARDREHVIELIRAHWHTPATRVIEPKHVHEVGSAKPDVAAGVISVQFGPPHND